MTRFRCITASDRLCLLAMLVSIAVVMWACSSTSSEPFDAPIAWGRP
ncbi:hypothetical protein AOPFMNJM_4005 [Methylobacterium jeotgali]|uniref:Uncharacterized protein n=1 Tax=Methylobacterium jeotgali TaxID=381630 RepID=A0ABQ4T0P3_9HYPH|nr:hypothetical protein AOPFMNJM_4005 [Methylobacterium jeotgali]